MSAAEPRASERRSLGRSILQLIAVFAIFCLFNKLGYYFSIEGTVSVFYPATAIDVLAVLAFGWIGALGVFLGTIATPWNPHDSLTNLMIVGALNAVEGLIPWAVFRLRRDLHRDLRDLRSFIAFLFFGTVLNSAVFAFFGNLLLIRRPGEWIAWRPFFIWWVSDLSGVLLIATPMLAFVDLTPRRLRRRRSIAHAMEITAAIILIGWVASTSIRTYLLGSYERDLLRQHKHWAELADAVARLQSLTLPNVPSTKPLAITGSGAVGDLQQMTGDDATLKPLAERVASAVRGNDRDQLQRALFDFRRELDLGERSRWSDFALRRTRIGTVAFMMDVILFVILGFAFRDLIAGISRPLQRMHEAISGLKKGSSFDAGEMPTHFVELQSLAETLDETSKTLVDREADLQIQTLKALEASRHKSDFLARMSHELRTPLNSIVGFSELLIERGSDVDERKRKNFLENIWRSGMNLLRLINDLLDIAKVESGKMKFHFAPTDLRGIVQNSVASTSPLFSRKRQRVMVEMPTESLTAEVDPVRIEQVLLNLLSNANKYSRHDDAIRVSLDREGEFASIEVEDHGVGINLQDQERIFEEFEQIRSEAPLEGTGLGLALARRFVEAHGGTLSVESSPGAGSVFTMRLPLKAVSPSMEA